MGRVKFDINGKGVAPGAGGNNYAGPNLPKGSYTAKIKRMTLGAIKSPGENNGKDRISVLLEVQTGAGDDGNGGYKYKGAPVWDGLNIISSSIPFVNAFLHGLTNGTESAKRAIETAFWDNGPIVKTITKKDGSSEKHIKRIGKYEINSPSGEILVQITTKAGSYKGEYKAEITGYAPYAGNGIPASEDDEEAEGEDMLEDDVEDDEDEPDDDSDADDEPEDDEEEDDEDSPDVDDASLETATKVAPF